MAPTDPSHPRPVPSVTRGRSASELPSNRITRRRLLALASGALATGVLAACGEETPAELAGVRLPDVSRPAPGARSDGELPEPGEARPIELAVTSYGGPLPIDLLVVLSTAARISQDRYAFGWAEVLSVPPYVEWDMSESIANLIPPLPDLILFHAGEFEDLVLGGSLMPLETHVASDPGFDSDAYWPGALEAGQVDGRQYALPLRVVPRVTVLNLEITERLGVELPPPDRQAFDRDAFLGLARELHTPPGVEGSGGTPGLLMRVNRDSDPVTQLFTAPPLLPHAHFFLASAVGKIGTPDGSYEGLRTDAAVRVVEDLRSMVNDLGYALPEAQFSRRLGDRSYGMNVTGFAGIKPAAFDFAIYPFPNFGGGRNPATIDWLAGVGSTSADPAAAYRAITPIGTALVQPFGFSALRTSPEELEVLYPDLTAEEAELVVDLLEHPAIIGLDRRDWPILVGLIDAGAVLGDLDPADALNRAADQLAALRDD